MTVLFLLMIQSSVYARANEFRCVTETSSLGNPNEILERRELVVNLSKGVTHLVSVLNGEFFYATLSNPLGQMGILTLTARTESGDMIRGMAGTTLKQGVGMGGLLDGCAGSPVIESQCFAASRTMSFVTCYQVK